MNARSACVFAIAVVVGCESSPPPIDTIDAALHRQDVDAWRAYRYDLLHEEGWLLLTGLHWLEEGENTFGSSDANQIVFRGDVPDRIGSFTVEGDRIDMHVAPGATVLRDGQPVRNLTLETGSLARGTVLTLGSVYWHIVSRGDQFAVRVRDSVAESFVNFDSIPSYPLAGEWRFNARFDRYDPPKPIMVPSILGSVNERPSPGAVVFEADGTTYRLDVVGEPEDNRFWIQFGDETNGFDTYGGGRYMWVDAPVDGSYTIVDFNKSYNPPCVFTPYATCPLPPRQNKLPLRIEAGELAYGGTDRGVRQSASSPGSARARNSAMIPFRSVTIRST